MMFVATVVLAGPVTLLPEMASAEGLFDLFFGGAQQKQKAVPAQANFFADPFGLNQPVPPPRPVASPGSGRYAAYCVRTCDGKYFPLTRGNASPAQMCQASCPASPTRVFSGNNIDGAVASNGERYADSENAFAYRKALKADCTCNGRDPAGLAPVDLALDNSLRPGDVVATADGLVVYSGIRLGANQAPDFAPIASFPGLTSEVRARLGEMKVAPVTAETVSDGTPSEMIRAFTLPPAAQKATGPRAKRAAAQ